MRRAAKGGEVELARTVGGGRGRGVPEGADGVCGGRGQSRLHLGLLSLALRHLLLVERRGTGRSASSVSSACGVTPPLVHAGGWQGLGATQGLTRASRMREAAARGRWKRANIKWWSG